MSLTPHGVSSCAPMACKKTLCGLAFARSTTRTREITGHKCSRYPRVVLRGLLPPPMSTIFVAQAMHGLCRGAELNSTSRMLQAPGSTNPGPGCARR